MKLKASNLPFKLGLILSIAPPALSAPTRIPEFAPKPPLGFNNFEGCLTYLSEDKSPALIAE